MQPLPPQWGNQDQYGQYGQYDQGNQYNQNNHDIEDGQYNQGSQGDQHNRNIQYDHGSQSHQEHQPIRDHHRTRDLQHDAGHRVIAAVKMNKKPGWWTKISRDAKWTRLLLLTMALQAIVGITLDGYTFGRWEANLRDDRKDNPNYSEVRGELRSVPTVLSLLLCGFIYQLLLTWDALRLKNTIQIFGIVMANLILMIYTIIQVDSTERTITRLYAYNIFKEAQMGYAIRSMAIAIPCILGVFTALAAFIAWKLYQIFAWDMLKTVGADYRMRQRYFHYHMYITLLKFDFFFFACFSLQYLVVVQSRSDRLTAITITTLPVILVTLIAAAFFTRKEWKWGVILVVFIYVVGLTYFIFMVTRIFDPNSVSDYSAVRKSMTAFAAFCMILLVTSIVYAFLCMSNFGKGLREQLEKPRAVVDNDQSSYAISDVKQPPPRDQLIID